MEGEFIDYYNILEVDIQATSDQIRSSYLKLAKKFHPDQGGHPEKFQMICKAYECLYNKESRKTYDLLYLKKSYEEINEDEFFRFKNDFRQFEVSNKKVISENKLTEMMNEVFKDKENFSEKALNDKDIEKRLNDISMERENQDIEYNNDKIKTVIEENELKINDIYDYNMYVNKTGGNTDIIYSNLGTVDILESNYCNFETFNSGSGYISNIYSPLDDENCNTENPNYLNRLNNTDIGKNLKINEIKEWKISKPKDTKLTQEKIDEYLSNRKKEEQFIMEDINSNLNNVKKRKEVNTFLKNNLEENLELTETFDNIKRRI